MMTVARAAVRLHARAPRVRPPPPPPFHRRLLATARRPSRIHPVKDTSRSSRPRRRLVATASTSFSDDIRGFDASVDEAEDQNDPSTPPRTFVSVPELVALLLDLSLEGQAIIREVTRTRPDLGVRDKGGTRNAGGEYVMDAQTEADRRVEVHVLEALRVYCPALRVVAEESYERAMSEGRGGGGSGDDDATIVDAATATEPPLRARLLAGGLALGVATATSDDAKEALSATTRGAWPPHLQSPIDASRVVVYVDPLDGTNEFAAGERVPVTSLYGVAVDGSPVAGVIGQPFYARDGREGRNVWGGRGVGVRGLSDGGVKSIESAERVRVAAPNAGERISVCVNRTWKENRTEAVIAAMSLRVGFKVSASGYHYLMLLEGEAQGAMLLREGAKKWDTCAGEALLRAIGGCTTDAVGRKYDYAHNLNGVLNLSGSASSVDANFHRAFTREIRRTLSPLGRYPYDVPDASIRPPLLPPAPRGGWKILTVDVGGCLLAPIEPVAKTYARLAMTRGFEGVTEKSAKTAIRAGFSAPPPASHPNVRYVGDGKSFWRPLVAGAMGVAPDEIEGNAKLEGVLDDLYAHYEDPRSWRVAHGAREAFRALRAHGVKVAVVSNWDTRLPKLLRDCGFDESSLDAVIVSAEVMADKPDRKIFAAALEAVGASLDRDASSAVHVGDSVVNDVEGAVDAGFGGALMFAPEMREGNVYDFTELADEIIGSRLES